MRILFLSDRFPPYLSGGYEIACASVAEGLRGRGHEVLVLTSNYGLAGTQPDEPGIRRELHYKQHAMSSWQLGRWDMADQFTLRKAILSWKPDVVYAWSLIHLFPSLHRVLGRARVPVFLNVQDIWLPQHLKEAEQLRALWYRSGPSLPKRVAKALIRTAFRWRNPDCLCNVTPDDLAHYQMVFCSRFRMEEHVRRGLPCRSRRLVYNGINVSQFRPAAAYAPGEPFRLLFAGRLVHEKGVHTVVEAVVELASRGLNQISLTVAGPPSYPFEYAKHLEETVDKAGLADRVRFLGQLPQDTLRAAYGHHHALVFPSIGNEGLPMTILEAMASGLPVVGTMTGGSAELLRDGETGLTYKAGNAFALADCLVALMDDLALRRSLAEAGRRLVTEQFSLETVVSETEGFLQDASNTALVDVT